MNATLILASASPRRKELMPLLGLPWTAQAAVVDEASVSHPDPAADAIQTAALKAQAVAAQAPAGAVVIGADTIVVVDGQKLGKPAGPQEARQMLRRLRGRTHQVYTGITLIDASSGWQVDDAAGVDVPMRDYSDAEIESYLATGDPLDKAGAYAIQHPGFRPVVGLEGCYAAVVGLPLCHLARSLRALGVAVTADVAAACQDHHGYLCPVYEAILSGEPAFGPNEQSLAQ